MQFIFDYRQNICEKLSKMIGPPPDQLILIVTMLSVIPFCFLNYLIHGKYPRLIYSLVLGLFFQYLMYQMNFINIFATGVITYLFIEFCGRKISASFVFFYTAIHLSVLHIIRLVYYYGEWTADDPTIIYMMTISKFSSLAFSYEDGAKKEIINKHHDEYKIIEKPSFLEVMSYIYFYPTSIVGPSFEFKDFINFINEKDCYTKLNEKFLYIFVNGFKYLIVSFICMAAYSIISNTFPLDYFIDKDFNHNLLYSLSYIFISVPGVRAKYYSGWVLSYSTLVFSGLSYTEKKEGDKIERSFEKGSYGSIIKVEWNTNPKDIINDWNKPVHLWLKYTIYTRVINIDNKIFKNNKPACNFLVFIYSAIWHGFYKSYYLSFGLLVCYKNACDILEKIGFYKFISKSKILTAITCIFNALAFETIGIIFWNLEWRDAMLGLKNIKYYPCIFIFGLYTITLLITMLFPKLLKKEKNEENKDKVKKNI